MSAPDFIELISPPIVDVYVGKQKRHWMLHKKLLCHHSPFFDKALNGNFAEARRRKVTLPDDHTDAFEFFTRWLYTGSFTAISGLTSSSGCSATSASYFRVWLLADKLGIMDLKNQAMDRIRETCRNANRYPNRVTLAKLCKHTPAGSSFGRFVVDIIAYTVTRPSMSWRNGIDFLEKYVGILTGEGDISFDVIKALYLQSKEIPMPNRMEAPNCTYHDHLDGKICTNTDVKNTTNFMMSLRELLSSPVVDVFVGVTKRHWILHRKLLCHHTSFFQKAFEGAFKEAGLGKLDLPDEDEKAFELFTMFIYGGSIGSLPLESTKDEFREFATTYFELWVLADKLGMNKMKNSAMDKYRASLRRVAGVLSPEDVKLIYRKTASDSIFRDMVAADVAYHLVRMSPETRGAWFRRCGEGANASLDCMVDMLSLGFSSSCDIDFEDPKKMPDEHYHDR